MSRHPVCCSVLKKISDGHQYPADPFAALADFKVILEKARQQTHHGLQRKTPSSPGAQSLIASTASRAYRSRYLGTLMHCCEALERVGKCVDQYSFECVDFHGLSQITVSLTRDAHFQSQMHFGDSVESIADSDLEDGELQKMLTSRLYAQ